MYRSMTKAHLLGGGKKKKKKEALGSSKTSRDRISPLARVSCLGGGDVRGFSCGPRLSVGETGRRSESVRKACCVLHRVGNWAEQSQSGSRLQSVLRKWEGQDAGRRAGAVGPAMAAGLPERCGPFLCRRGRGPQSAAAESEPSDRWALPTLPFPSSRTLLKQTEPRRGEDAGGARPRAGRTVQSPGACSSRPRKGPAPSGRPRGQAEGVLEGDSVQRETS